MDTLLHDLRFALRTLIKNPGFTIAAGATLALGIGANTAVFSVVNGVLLRPLPYPEPERVVYLGWRRASGNTNTSITAWKYDYFRRNTTVFDAVATHRGWATEIGEGETPSEVRGLRASAGFFTVNGILPALGREFLPEEDRPGSAPVVVLSDELWRERFDADPNILGRSVGLGDQPHEVVGVMPAGFRFPELADYADFIVPFRLEPDVRDEGINYFVRARLRSDVSRDEALAELGVVSQRFREDHPDLMEANEVGIANEVGVRFLDFGDVYVGGTGRTLWLLLGAVGFVLLIACANVANLLLVRSAGRQREMAIRSAIGAGRRRILRQLVTESLLLALVAAVAGLLIGQWSLSGLLALAPADLPRAEEVGLDVRVLGFTLGVAALTGVLFGLAAALDVARTNLSGVLRQAGTRQAGDRTGSRIRSVFAASEAAIAVVLLAGAGLLIVTFLHVRSVDPGFDPEGVLSVEFPRTPEQYTMIDVWNFERQVLERVHSLPGVASAGATSVLPLRGQYNFPMTVVGRPDATRGDVQWRAITPGYFDALGVPLVRGRAFAEHDDAVQAAPVVMVNETFARKYFPAQDPVGQRIDIGTYQGQDVIPDFDDPQREIVGVVGDIHALGLRQDAEETMYIPRAQAPSGNGGPGGLGGIIIRASAASQLGPQLLDVIREIDPRMPAPEVRTMSEVIGLSVTQERFYTVLLSIFAALALTLAAIGIYGVSAFTVRQRTGEIGIRMALGANRISVLTMVVRQAMLPVAIGLGAGLVAALALTRLMTGLLYDVSSSDPATFLSVAATLAGVALVATYLPARQAATVDPLVALRSE